MPLCPRPRRHQCLAEDGRSAPLQTPARRGWAHMMSLTASGNHPPGQPPRQLCSGTHLSRRQTPLPALGAGAGRLPNVSVRGGEGCPNGGPQTGWLKPQTLLFSLSWRLVVPGQGAGRFSFSRGPLGLSLCVHPRGLSFSYACCIRAPHLATFNLHHRFQGPLSKQCHSEALGVRT